jgi:hypothetical protein
MVAWHCSELASSAKLGLQLGLDLKLWRSNTSSGHSLIYCWTMCISVWTTYEVWFFYKVSENFTKLPKNTILSTSIHKYINKVRSTGLFLDKKLVKKCHVLTE